MMTEIKFYEVYDTYSEDGWGNSTTIARIKDYAEALKYAKRRGNYNNDANVKETILYIADTANDMEDYDEEAMKNAALNKLTRDERKLLGLE